MRDPATIDYRPGPMLCNCCHREADELLVPGLAVRPGRKFRRRGEEFVPAICRSCAGQLFGLLQDLIRDAEPRAGLHESAEEPAKQRSVGP